MAPFQFQAAGFQSHSAALGEAPCGEELRRLGEARVSGQGRGLAGVLPRPGGWEGRIERDREHNRERQRRFREKRREARLKVVKNADE